MPHIVQFLHPGKEAEPLKPNDLTIEWNNHLEHRRKFIVSEGRSLDCNNHLIENKLAFWDEWEAQSKIKVINKGNKGAPRYFNFPFLDISVPKRFHTTDPFVFGERFRYFICRQQACFNLLPNLSPGSIILFGSNINRHFCLDTLFVVSEIKMHYTLYDIKLFASQLNKDAFYYAGIEPVMFNAKCVEEKNEEGGCLKFPDLKLTCYQAVSYDEKESYNGIFSFAPCKYYEEENPIKSVFVQPEINLEFISPTMTRGIKAIEVSYDKVQAYWSNIVEQIRNSNLGLGVRFKMPPFVKNYRATL